MPKRTAKTTSERLSEKNRKANVKHKKDQTDTAQLHEEIRQGKKTAGQALKERAGKTQTERLQERNGEAVTASRKRSTAQKPQESPETLETAPVALEA